MDMAGSPRASRHPAHQQQLAPQPQHHPHQGHPYESYPPSPSHRSAAASSRREQQQQQQQQQHEYYHGQPQHPPSGPYPPHMPGYFPHANHSGPNMSHHGAPSAGGPSRHAYPPGPPEAAPGYAMPPHQMHPHPSAAGPHHQGLAPQPYPQRLAPLHPMGMPMYEGDMMEMDAQAHAHYAAQQHSMGYPPGMGPVMPYPQPHPNQHTRPASVSQQANDVHPGAAGASASQPHPQPPPPPPQQSNSQASAAPAPSKSKAKTKGSSRKDKQREQKEKQAAAAATNSGKASGGAKAEPTPAQTKAQAAKEAKEAKAEAAAAAAKEGNTGESKKDKKKREVIDRIHRMHWEAVESREETYQNSQSRYLHEHTTLLTSPLLSRDYSLKLSFCTMQREAALRQCALLHAHQVETARKSYETERAKVEDEAKQARKVIRERLTAAVEERRQRLKEDKESGEGGADTLLDSSTRPHPTRKLRNKHTGTSRRLAMAAGDIDSGDESSIGSSAAPVATTGKERNRDGALGPLVPPAGLGLLSGSKGMEGTAPILGLGGLPELSLLENSLKVFENDVAANARPRAPAKGRNGKKRQQQEVVVPVSESTTKASEEEAHLSKKAKKELERDRLAFLALAASSLPPTLTGGAGGAGTGSGPGGTKSLRWEPGRSVLQLTGAKDYETESDLIRIKGGLAGGKRRRGAAAAAGAAALA